jgi:hypothetical protein
MDDEPFDLSIEPEPDNGILTMRLRRVRVDSHEAIDQLVAMVEPLVSAFDQPCYLLFDITGLQLSPRLRTYVTAGSQPLHPFVRGMAVFTHRPNPVAELLLRIAMSEIELFYAACATEAEARAAIASFQVEEARRRRSLV